MNQIQSVSTSTIAINIICFSWATLVFPEILLYHVFILKILLYVYFIYDPEFYYRINFLHKAVPSIYDSSVF